MEILELKIIITEILLKLIVGLAPLEMTEEWICELKIGQ